MARDAVMPAVLRLGFSTFEDYVCARTGKQLVEMAAELGVNKVTFVAFHNRWIRAKMRTEEDADAASGHE